MVVAFEPVASRGRIRYRPRLARAIQPAASRRESLATATRLSTPRTRAASSAEISPPLALRAKSDRAARGPEGSVGVVSTMDTVVWATRTIPRLFPTRSVWRFLTCTARCVSRDVSGPGVERRVAGRTLRRRGQGVLLRCRFCTSSATKSAKWPHYFRGLYFTKKRVRFSLAETSDSSIFSRQEKR